MAIEQCSGSRPTAFKADPPDLPAIVPFECNDRHRSVIIEPIYDNGAGGSGRLSKKPGGILGTTADLRVVSRDYDTDGQLITVTSPEGTLHYDYDVHGRRTRTWTGSDAQSVRTNTRYVFDSLGRLDAVEVHGRNSQAVSPAEVTDYVYDLLGNLDEVRLANGAIADYQYDDLNRLELLRHFTDTNTNGTYQAGVDALLAEFYYDLLADGRRSGVTETDHLGRTTRIDWTYDDVGRLTRESYDSHDASLDFITDSVFDLVGNRLEKKTGNAYGVALGFDPAAALTTLLYSGEQFDQRLGMQYLRARYYDLAAGRFMRVDPFFGNLEDPLSLHKYLYVHGDPVQGVDPSGQWTVGSLFGAAFVNGTFGGLVGGAVGGIYAGLTGNSITSGIWIGASGGFIGGFLLPYSAAGAGAAFAAMGFSTAFSAAAGLLAGGVFSGAVSGGYDGWIRGQDPIEGAIFGGVAGILGSAIGKAIGPSLNRTAQIAPELTDETIRRLAGREVLVLGRVQRVVDEIADELKAAGLNAYTVSDPTRKLAFMKAIEDWASANPTTVRELIRDSRPEGPPSECVDNGEGRDGRLRAARVGAPRNTGGLSLLVAVRAAGVADGQGSL